ncbi:MAG TPA: FAD-dependent oxidoreductase [Nitrospira sp.]|nr:FAD-dependent oxidoreductase [Nitrospira sp.]
MKLAIVGTGIAGMTAAHLLHDEHDLTIYEAGEYIGGHTNTVEVEREGMTYAVDTGFIVFNDWTYPNFIGLLDRLGVASQPSDMSFSVRCEDTGLEYNGTSLNRLFAQRRNLLRPSFYRMIRDILRFNRESVKLLDEPGPGPSLGAYLEQNRYSPPFIRNYIIPMAGAIWSAGPSAIWRYPARYLVQFFKNHGMLSVDARPTWRVITGGSQRYVEKLVRPFRERIRLQSPVEAIIRDSHGVEVRSHDRAGTSHTARFDGVVLACHSDQALALLADPSPLERDVLGAIRYQANEAILHTDQSLLPRRRRAWAAWNYHLLPTPADRVLVTYHMNTLQRLRASCDFCVTLNRPDAIDPAQILKRITYHHPVFTPEAIAAQQRHREINGQRRTWYCGAYWGFGFHEDGVKSAMMACESLRAGQA